MCEQPFHSASHEVFTHLPELSYNAAVHRQPRILTYILYEMLLYFRC